MGYLAGFFGSIQGIVSLALTVATVVDAIRHRRGWLWVWLAVFLPVVGPAIYLVNFYLMDSMGWRRIAVAMQRDRRLKELRNLAKIQDTAALHLEMGELFFDRKEYRQAVESLKRALDIDPELMRAHYFAGRSLLQLDRPDGAIAHLEYVTDSDPRYLYGEAMLALARAYQSAGRGDEAFATCERALETTGIAEAVCLHAGMLAERGERERAREQLERLVREASAFPHFKPSRDRKWIAEAKKALKSL